MRRWHSVWALSLLERSLCTASVPLDSCSFQFVICKLDALGEVISLSLATSLFLCMVLGTMLKDYIFHWQNSRENPKKTEDHLLVLVYFAFVNVEGETFANEDQEVKG